MMAKEILELIEETKMRVSLKMTCAVMSGVLVEAGRNISGLSVR